MRCPNCNKFATYDTGAEPELDLEAQAVGNAVGISGTARIVLTSECCSEELKEANFDVDLDVLLPDPPACTCATEAPESFEVTSKSAEITSRSETEKRTVLKSGKVKVRPIPFRYQRTFYGVHVDLEVTCGCGKTVLTEEFDDEIRASGMDELV